MKPVRPKLPSRKTGQKTKLQVKDPIEVFCRIRPMYNKSSVACIRAENNKTVVMAMQDNSNLPSKTMYKEVHYTFKHVFDEETSQKALFDQVSLPLIKDLLEGMNGLLFTYGITSSGKTYTMTGTPQDCGILPRSLDVIFNSIKDLQAIKYVFKPDRLNGFDVQTFNEAQHDQQKEAAIANKAKSKKRDHLADWVHRACDETVCEDVDSDSSFAVFVSYVEIYNNYIYDLLEDTPTETHLRSKLPQSKLLREDPAHNMYVFGTTEVEVKTANEALDQFIKGQIRRRISNTALNAESSRSHSVFTVRVAQAPLDPLGSNVVQDRNMLTVSQFSMVDLAGSERAVRTRNIGVKLRETGNINSSLMALRTCIEMLRDNQGQTNAKMVPYRESKLTLLFKSFFEGEGKIRMVVCVNPAIDEYEETIHVMRFAELTQDVMIARPTPVATPVNLGMKSGRGNMFREAVRRVQEEGGDLNNYLEPIVLSLGPEFPSFDFNGNVDEEEVQLMNLLQFLTARKERRSVMQQDLTKRQDEFRQALTSIDKECATLKQENVVLQMDLSAREQQVKVLECTLCDTEEKVQVLQQKVNTYEKTAESLKHKLNEKSNLLSEGDKERERLRNKMHEKINFQKERMQRVLEKRLAQKQAELERKMCFSEEKFRQLREILNAGDWEFGADLMGFLNFNQPASDCDNPEPRMTRAKTVLGVGIPAQSRASASNAMPQLKATSDTRVDQAGDTNEVFNRNKGIAVANPRHRRSQSGDVWLDHKPAGCLDLGTVLQPKMKKKKSVSKLEVKDVIHNDVSKYVLTHQEQDSKGEVETQLYKGDVIPSAGGGAQIIFNDIEKLKQVSPPAAYNLRKRSAENLPLRNIEDRCTVALECHGIPSKVSRRAK